MTQSIKMLLSVLGSRSYVSGLLIDTRVVALLGLRTRRDLISGQVEGDIRCTCSSGRKWRFICVGTSREMARPKVR